MPRKTKVLVIDSLQERRSSIRTALEAAGFEVSTAGSGRRGLTVLKATRFDILLADVSTRQADGIAVIKRVHKEQLQLRVFAIASNEARVSIETASTLAEVWGAERVFTRQFDATTLLAAIGHDQGRASDGKMARTK